MRYERSMNSRMNEELLDVDFPEYIDNNNQDNNKANIVNSFDDNGINYGSDNTQSQNIVGEVEPPHFDFAARAMSTCEPPEANLPPVSAHSADFDRGEGNMDGEEKFRRQSLPEEEIRLLQRPSHRDFAEPDSRRTSDSSTHTRDTDAITKMMYELWGNRKQLDNIPTEETSARLSENIEKIVARELYEMNKAEREAIVEELHGVKSRSIPESPELIQSTLDAFAEEAMRLSHNTKTTDTDINGVKHPIGQAHLRAVEHLKSTYVVAPEFRLRFLRTEFFDVKKAVLRYCKYLNHIWDLFGDVALVRQIALNDLNKQEQKYLKSGQVQGLLSRDKMGRRIYALFGVYDAPIRERTRVETYLSFAAIADDETTQSVGATLVAFFSMNEKSVIRFDRDERHILQKMIACVPVRYTALHFCMPDEPVYSLLKTIVHSLMPPTMRAGMRVHTGSPLECNYALCQFGIPVDDIPKSVTGTIKNKSIQKFIRARMAMEDYRRERCRLLGVPYVTKAMEEELVAAAEASSQVSSMSHQPSPLALERLALLGGFPPSCPGTDCPELDCIVFGDRVTYKHPPNVRFRDYLRGKRHRQEELKEQERQQQRKEKRRKERIFSAEFLDEIISEASELLGYKFATYDKDAGWYAYIDPSTPENKQELRKKISQLMRDERKRERAAWSGGLGLMAEAASEAIQSGSNSSSGSVRNRDEVIVNNSRTNNRNVGGAESDGSDGMNADMAFFSMPGDMRRKRRKSNVCGKCTVDVPPKCEP